MAIIALGEKLHGLVKKLLTSKKKKGSDGGGGYTKLKKLYDTKPAPKGFIHVYVGEERKKYVLPIKVFCSATFMSLLHSYEDQIPREEPISLPCSTATFEVVLSLIQEGEGQALIGDRYQDYTSSKELRNLLEIHAR